MANRFSLQAAVRPTIDEQQAEREAEGLADTIEQKIGDVTPDIEGGGIPGVAGGIGGGGGGAGGAAAGAGLLGRLGGAGGLAKVALGGAIGFGILTATQKLAQASPALEQVTGMLGEALSLFFRPFGNFLAGILRPFAAAGLNMAVRFNELAESEGLAVAIGKITAEAAASFGTGMVNAFGKIASGEGTLADFLFAGAGTIALTKLVTGVSITSLISSVSLSSLVTSVGAGSILTSVSAGTVLTSVAAGGLLTAVPAAAVLTSVAVSKLIHGELEMPSDEPGASTPGGEEYDPEQLEDFQDAVERSNTTGDIATGGGGGAGGTPQPPGIPDEGTVVRNGVIYRNGVRVGTVEEAERLRDQGGGDTLPEGDATGPPSGDVQRGTATDTSDQQTIQDAKELARALERAAKNAGDNLDPY